MRALVTKVTPGPQSCKKSHNHHYRGLGQPGLRQCAAVPGDTWSRDQCCHVTSPARQYKISLLKAISTQYLLPISLATIKIRFIYSIASQSMDLCKMIPKVFLHSAFAIAMHRKYQQSLHVGSVTEVIQSTSCTLMHNYTEKVGHY